MNRRNPFSHDGTFSTVDMVAEVERELKRMTEIFDGWVRAGRMRAENRDHRLGTMETLLAELKERMVQRLPSELQEGPAVIVHFRSHAHLAEFEESGPATYHGITAIRPI